MSRVSDTPRLVGGDRVMDHRGNEGIARECTNRTTREKFIGVFITAGPLKNTWAQKVWQFEPLLDHEGGTLSARCVKCDRLFLATVRTERVGALQTKDVPKQEKCRTCTGYTRTAAQKDRDRQLDATSDDMRKTKHHAVPLSPEAAQRLRDEQEQSF
jgi:hypothetical protein